MVIRSDHFSVLFRFAPSPRKVTAFSLARRPAPFKGVIITPLHTRHPPAIVESVVHRAVIGVPVADVILEFEGMVTFAL
jgi:hypothetical protein